MIMIALINLLEITVWLAYRLVFIRIVSCLCMSHTNDYFKFEHFFNLYLHLHLHFDFHLNLKTCIALLEFPLLLFPYQNNSMIFLLFRAAVECRRVL